MTMAEISTSHIEKQSGAQSRSFIDSGAVNYMKM
jgi:hypothetical protein